MLAQTATRTKEDLREYQEMLNAVFRDNRVQRNLKIEGWGCVSPEKAYIHCTKGGDFLLKLEEVALEYSCLCAERFGIPQGSDPLREMLLRNSQLASSFVAQTIFYGLRSKSVRFAADIFQIAQRFIDRKEDFFSIDDGAKFRDFLNRECFA